MRYAAALMLAVGCFVACSGETEVAAVGGDVGTGTITAGAAKWKGGAGSAVQVQGFVLYYTPAQPQPCPVVSCTFQVFTDRNRNDAYDAGEQIGTYNAVAIPGGNGRMSAAVTTFTYNAVNDGPITVLATVTYGPPCENHRITLMTHLEPKK